jgi:hypothetical protein
VKGLTGMMIDTTDANNENVDNKFRNACSNYDCYLISEKGQQYLLWQTQQQAFNGNRHCGLIFR